MKFRYLLLGFALGLLVAWWWATEESRVDVPASPSPAPAKPPARPSPNAQSKDALTEIEGIGPAYERALNALGVFTFQQLAQQDADALAAELSARVTADRIRRERWIEQAKKRTK